MKYHFRSLAALSVLSSLVLSSVFVASAQSKSAQSQKAPTLSFDVTASAARTGSKSAAQAVNARVHLRGERARVETKLGGQEIVVLLAEPYVYRLLPASKSGVRYKATTPLPEMGLFAANWPELMRNPQKIRALLKQQGAKKVGNAVIGGTQTEVYSADKWNGQARKVKLWLRRNDALPVRMETSAGGTNLTINWKNYRRGHTLAATLFAVPRDYRIREGQAPQRMSL